MPKASCEIDEEDISLEPTRSRRAGGQIILGENLSVLRRLPHAFARMIYIDPPFNTGRTQRRWLRGTPALTNGDRLTSTGRCHHSNRRTIEYQDQFDDHLAFLIPRIEASLHCLTADGSLFVHLDSAMEAFALPSWHRYGLLIPIDGKKGYR